MGKVTKMAILDTDQLTEDLKVYKTGNVYSSRNKMNVIFPTAEDIEGNNIFRRGGADTKGNHWGNTKGVILARIAQVAKENGVTDIAAITVNEVSKGKYNYTIWKRLYE